MSKEVQNMSRIGKLPVPVPKGVDISLAEGNLLTVKGPKGTLTRKLSADMNIAQEEDKLVVTRPSDLKKFKALHGLTRTLINNMVVGVTVGFTKKLEINGTGYRAAKSGNKLSLVLGYSHPIEMLDPEGVTTEVEGNNKITVSGIDKEKVGQHAANIRSKRGPEPFKGKGIKYDTEKIRRKAGKAGKK
jgi:large subunit ribosomal protein L6